MRAHKVLVIGVALALLLSGPGWAAKETILRFAGVSVNPTDDLRLGESESMPLGDGTTLFVQLDATAEADNSAGFCLDFERRFTDRVGLGVTLMYTEPDLDIRGTETVRITDDATAAVLLEATDSVALTGSGDMMPLLVGPNFHFGPDRRVDLYAGPFLGYVAYGDVTIDGERAEIDDDFAYGAVLGLDIPFGEGKAGFSAAARYMVTEAAPKDGGDALGIDPLTVQLGLSYRF